MKVACPNLATCLLATWAENVVKFELKLDTSEAAWCDGCDAGRVEYHARGV